MQNVKSVYVILLVILALLVGSCATYYEKSLKFQELVYKGELDKAKAYLDKNEKDARGKNQMLYLMYEGWLSWMLGNNEESNVYLQEADHLIEDYRKQLSYEAATLITNPGIKPYQPEDFEKVMVNYIKALNYLELGQYKEALVEVRRINIKLHEINDQYKEHKNRYSDDAFANVIMGLIYDANREYNDAFIAYRNAYETYKKIYTDNFNVGVPLQLKKDLLRTAYQNRFIEELEHYEKEFGMKYEPTTHSGGELVFIWQNGLGPVKAEWGIDFVKTNGEAGFIMFHNEELGLTFPFYIGDKSNEEKSAFAQLSVMRVAFPKYLERKPVLTQAKISADGKDYPLELAEDLNAIAFKTLHDRMIREITNSLLRLATKKAMEFTVRKQNEDIGAAVGILNALTEKADTRNWQTLPYAIYYTRVPLDTGHQVVQFSASGHQTSDTQKYELEVARGATYFRVFQSLETFPPESASARYQ